MPLKILSTFDVGDMVIRYLQNERTKRVGMQLVPKSMVNEIVEHRERVGPGGGFASEGDSLIHVALAGTPAAAGFAQGRTMRFSPPTQSLQYANQAVGSGSGRTTIATRFKSVLGFTCEHLLSWQDGDESVEVQTRLTNMGQLPLSLEMLTSFSLGYITPFAADDAAERLMLHRFRTSWSQEGRLDSGSIEQLHLEPSWAGHGISSERFGQVGTLPCRGFFPTAAVEDKKFGVIWAAQLYWAGSWQMEASRKNDFLCLSGGLADREFGHWVKTLAPNQTITTPSARLTCARASLEETCQRLTAAQQRAVDLQPASEQDLPIIFNEYCTTWGDPSHEKLLPIADRLRDTIVKYFVIDAGWYKADDGSWSTGQGDWNASAKLFPQGLKSAADDIRARGLTPGIWFEWEVAGAASAAFKLADRMLKRDGVPITCGDRRFWNLNDPGAVSYISEKVIELLVQCGFGYLKIDYNDTIGIGCDGAESLGEGLRQQVEAYHRMLDIIRRRLPYLVMENCASGGHRLEPSVMAKHAMGSFSDAHECIEIPVIAANLHNLILPRQSQIWAVLRQKDDAHRLIYSLAATFLGRMCLSGEIAEMPDESWATVNRAMMLYQDVVPIIRQGISRRVSPVSASLRHPKGYQAVVRTGSSQAEALVVVHTFAESPRQVEIPLPAGGWKVAGELLAPEVTFEIQGEKLIMNLGRDFSAGVLHLRRA